MLLCQISCERGSSLYSQYTDYGNYHLRDDVIDFFENGIPHVLVRWSLWVSRAQGGREGYYFLFSDEFVREVRNRFPDIEITEPWIIDTIDEHGPKHPEYGDDIKSYFEVFIFGDKNYHILYAFYMIGEIANKVKYLSVPEGFTYNEWWDIWCEYGDSADSIFEIGVETYRAAFLSEQEQERLIGPSTYIEWSWENWDCGDLEPGVVADLSDVLLHEIVPCGRRFRPVRWRHSPGSVRQITRLTVKHHRIDRARKRVGNRIDES